MAAEGALAASPLQWSEISRHVWETQYRDAAAGERSIDATWSRVASAAASADGGAGAADAGRAFHEILRGFRFLPGGRILAGAGTAAVRTLANCFVMGPIGDSIEGIFTRLKESAVTMQWGGGIGFIDVEGLNNEKLGGWLMGQHRVVQTPITHPEFRGIRITPNVYTTLDEIDRFSELVLRAMQKGIA